MSAHPPTGPTPESLTLSASLFHADVDAWLPTSFGVSKPEVEKNNEWEAALRSSAERSQRLGLGHAALDNAALGAKFKNQRAGLDILASRLKRKAADEARAGTAVSNGQARDNNSDDDEAIESRTKSISKTKKKSDPFAKVQSKAHPALMKGKEEKVHPALLSSLGKRSRDSGSDQEEEQSVGADEEEKEEGPILSKAERKREKKRKQKLRKAAGATAEAAV